MDALVRDFDWASTPLGPQADWPCSLRTAVQMVLACRLPMYLAWGPEHTQIYNDAYVPILGPRHPAALGATAPTTWSEIWPTIGPMWADVLAGQPIGFDDFRLTIERFGYPEDRFFNFSYSPVADDDGALRGVLVTFVDTTDRVIAERRAQFQLDLADRLRGLDDPNTITTVACGVLGEHLEARRVGYASVSADAIDVQFTGWHDGSVDSVVGQRLPADAFGPAVTAELQAGRTVVIEDAHADARTRGSIALYDTLRCPSMVVVPLQRQSSVIAVLVVGGRAIRRWTPMEINLIEDAAERTRSAVERAFAEQTLLQRTRRDHARLLALFNEAPVFIASVRGPDHLFEFANRAYVELMGQRELIGRRVVDPIPESAEQGFVAVADAVLQTGEAAVGRGVPFIVRDAHGERRQVYTDYTFQPLLGADGRPEGILVVGSDVTDRMVAEAALRETEMRFRLMADTVSQILWITDGDGRAEYMNRQWEAYTGLPFKPVMASAVSDSAVHPEDHDRTVAAFEHARATATPFQVEHRIRGRDGTYRWFLVRAQPHIDADTGRIDKWFGASVDIHDLKSAEQALTEADRRKDEFLAMLAHELRNPLAPLGVSAELLRRSEGHPERIARIADTVDRQVRHLTTLVDDLLDVSRVTRGIVEIERAPVDLKRVFAAAVEQVRPLIDARGHALSQHMAPGAVIVEGDASRLVQVVANLLNNAARYTPPGGAIDLDLDVEGEDVVVSVRDNGSGIPPALLARVFELFTQGDRTLERSQGGLGIGLAVVRGIVELHGGDVAAFSDGEGHGSLFRVRLPRMEVDGSESEDVAGHAARRAQGPVLVVDDNRDAADSLAEVLRLIGYDVTVAYSPGEALARAGDADWHACLLDIGLPDMDGYELRRRLAERFGDDADCRMVAVTGYGQPSDRARSREAGFDAHLTKPVDVDALIRVLDAG